MRFDVEPCYKPGKYFDAVQKQDTTTQHSRSYKLLEKLALCSIIYIASTLLKHLSTQLK